MQIMWFRVLHSDQWSPAAKYLYQGFCDPNVMVVHPLVSKIWAGTDQKGTLFDNNWRPSWMCHSGQNGCWTGVSSNRKEAISSISAQMHHMQESYKRVRKCAKGKGRVELKIALHLHPILQKKVKVIERSDDVTPRWKYDKSKGHPSSPCPSNLVQFRLLFSFWKN